MNKFVVKTGLLSVILIGIISCNKKENELEFNKRISIFDDEMQKQMTEERKKRFFDQKNSIFVIYQDGRKIVKEFLGTE